MSINSFGQDSLLFKIVCASDNVTLDGNSVTIGQSVYSNSKELELPKDGYIGVISKEGYACLIKKNTKTENVRRIAFRQNDLSANGKTPVNRFSATGAVHRWSEAQFHFLPDVSPNNSTVYGDSLVLMWIDRKGNRSPYVITYMSIMEEIISRDTTNHNWVAFDVEKIMLGQPILLFGLQVADRDSLKFSSPTGDMQVVKRMKPETTSPYFDLNRVPVNDPDAEIMRMAVLQLRLFPYDQAFLEYKWLRDKKTARSVPAINYFINETKKNSLDKFDFTK